MKKQAIRILQYIGSLNVGGSQSMVMELYRNIDREKIQFDFIIDRKYETFYEDEINFLGGKVYKFENYLNGFNYFEFINEWNNFFKIHPEYKIIHCHVRSTASIILKIAKSYNLKTICHSHSTSNGKGIKSIVKKILQKNIHKYADYLFACSMDSAIWLYGEKKAKSDKCFIINNAIDSLKYSYNLSIRNKVRKELNLENKIILGQVGRIEKVKNYNFSLELLRQCLEKDDRFVLLVVGDGSLANEMKNTINELNLLEKVLMLGNRNDVNELMQAMDIYIMPSLWEGLPLSLIEAQASDLPCIISNKITAGILDKELVNQLDINNNYEEWVNAINKKININRCDKSKLIKENNFDIKSNVEWLEKFYINML